MGCTNKCKSQTAGKENTLIKGKEAGEGWSKGRVHGFPLAESFLFLLDFAIITKGVRAPPSGFPFHLIEVSVYKFLTQRCRQRKKKRGGNIRHRGRTIGERSEIRQERERKEKRTGENRSEENFLREKENKRAQVNKIFRTKRSLVFVFTSKAYFLC